MQYSAFFPLKCESDTLPQGNRCAGTAEMNYERELAMFEYRGQCLENIPFMSDAGPSVSSVSPGSSGDLRVQRVGRSRPVPGRCSSCRQRRRVSQADSRRDTAGPHTGAWALSGLRLWRVSAG